MHKAIFTSMIGVMVVIPSGIYAAPSCADGVLGSGAVSGACTSLLGAAGTVCPAAVLTGGMEPISGSLCAITVTAASWVCWASIPAIIAAVVNCFV